MEIWIFNEYAYSPDMPGGTRHYDLAHELVKKGHEVAIFATSFHHHRHQEMRLDSGDQWKIETINGVKFVWIHTPAYIRNDWRRVWNHLVFTVHIWKLGKNIPILTSELKEPDIIIGSSPHLFTPFAAYRLARYYNIPFVMEIRDLWPQVFIDLKSPFACYPIVKPLQLFEKYLYRRSSSIITLGPQMGDYITSLGVSGENITWIPNGVDLSSFNIVNIDRKISSDDDFKIIYLGAHGPANSLQTLVYAAKTIRDLGLQSVSFLLIGDGPEKPVLIDLVKDLDLTNVLFREPVPKTEVSKVLADASALIVTFRDSFSNSGGSLNKLSDYMASGKPVIFSCNAGYNPVDEASCGITVPPEDPYAIAEAVRVLYSMTPKERQEMGMRGRNFVEKYHNITKLAETLEHLLMKAIDDYHT